MVDSSWVHSIETVSGSKPTLLQKYLKLSGEEETRLVHTNFIRKYLFPTTLLYLRYVLEIL